MDTSSRSADEYSRTVTAIGTAIAKGDLRRAYELANWAIERGMEGRVIYNARALAYQASGRFNEAIIDFRKALKYAPNDYTIHNALGVTLAAQGRSDEAVVAFDAALAVKPDDAVIHFRRGGSLGQLENPEAAEEAYQRAIALKPDFIEPRAAIAAIAGRQGKFEKAREHAARILATNPDNAVANYAMALVEMGERRYPEAEQRLKRLILNPDMNAETRGGMYGLLGDAIDAQKRYAEAFEIYARGNEYVRRELGKDFENTRIPETVRHLTAYFETASSEHWRAPDNGDLPADGPSEHVFLMGFMRSGTTLLEQVLASNPNVVALEEKPTITPFSQKYFRGSHSVDTLAALQGESLERDRAEYWQNVREHAPDLKGKVLIDKHPLNSIRMPIIAKLFPRAKILFAIRDPRDVVFSCYRRPFAATATMFEFQDQQDAAKFYAAVMNLAKLCRAKLPLNVRDHYYEDMVTDFETRVRAVCDFIGLEWSDSMREFNRNAPPNINSPSASQVRRPIYGEGIGYWRNYAEQLQPMMPILKPWVEEFGYSPE